MNGKPVFPLPPVIGVMIASAAAAIIGMTGWAMFEGIDDPLTLVLMTLIGGWLVAFALAGLAGTQILRVVTAHLGSGGWSVVITGVLTGVVPTCAGMLLAAARAWGDGVSRFALSDWGHPLIAVSIAGAFGGWVFWLVSGDEV